MINAEQFTLGDQSLWFSSNKTEFTCLQKSSCREGKLETNQKNSLRLSCPRYTNTDLAAVNLIIRQN